MRLASTYQQLGAIFHDQLYTYITRYIIGPSMPKQPHTNTPATVFPYRVVFTDKRLVYCLPWIVSMFCMKGGEAYINAICFDLCFHPYGENEQAEKRQQYNGYNSLT